jgi:hypothetical protein
MKFRFCIVLALSLGCLLPLRAAAQSAEGDTPLGDIARALRRAKKAETAEQPKAPQQPQPVVIDNDNLSKVMDEAESQRLKGNVKFSFSGEGKDFQVSSPDVTCSLSFNAQATSLLSDPFVPQSMPASEVVKLDGPATISGNTLQISVYNPTRWKVNEITVGLTILRSPDSSAGYYGSAKLRPASANDSGSAANSAGEKRPDLTVLYHLKGNAAPSTTAVFRESLGATLDPDQDWHWAIVEAKGIPPK